MATAAATTTDVATAGGAERARAAPWGLAALALSMLISSLGTSIANVALPTLARAFDASFQQVQWVVLAYLLSITVFIVTVGRLGDIIGRRRLLLAGLGLFTAASALCGAATTLTLLIAARAVQGLGAAVLLALTLAFVGEMVPRERVGSAMGLLGTMSAVGTALGPSLGGVLVAGVGWRAIFLVNVPLGVLTCLVTERHLPVDRPSAANGRPGLDHLGTVLLAATLAAYALAMTLGRGHFGALNLTLLLATIVGGGLFVLAESQAPSPLLRLATLRDPRIGAGVAMSALVSTVVMATLVVGPFYLSRALALDTAAVGIVMTVGPLVAALTGVPAGRLVDRFGASRGTVSGLLGMTAGALALAVSPPRMGIAGYLLPIGLLTAGYALFQAANNTAVMGGAGQEQRGVVSGLLNLSRNLGLVTGAAVMGAIFAHASGASDVTTADPGAVGSGMRFTFAVATGLLVVSLAAAVVSARRAGRHP